MVKINMIEKISYFLAKKIYMCSEADVTCVVDEKNEDVQVLQYGIECMINMSIPFMVIFVCAWYFKMLIPMLIWCVMFLMLRNYIGGYHAKTHFRCILYSSVYGVIAMYGIIWLAVVPLTVKLIVCGGLLLINIFTGPVIHDENLKGYKRNYCKIGVVILAGGVVCAVFLNLCNVKLGNAVFMGIISAEFLYGIDLLINRKKDRAV